MLYCKPFKLKNKSGWRACCQATSDHMLYCKPFKLKNKSGWRACCQATSGHLWHMYSEISGSFVTYVQWNIRLLKPPVCYMSPQLIVPPCRNYWCMRTNIVEGMFLLWKGHWHIESKQMLHHPVYLIIIVNRITYSNNRSTKNNIRMPLDLYIKLGLTHFP